MSKRYFVECVKCGVSNDGMACGPVEGAVNATVKYSVDGEVKWLTNSEFTGIPNFYLTDRDIFEDLMKAEFDDEFLEYMQNSYIGEFNGIKLGEYDEIEEAMNEQPENEAIDLIEYLVELTRCETEDTDRLIKAGTQEYADMICLCENEREKTDYSTLDEEELFKYRLNFESQFADQSVYFEMLEPIILKQLKKDYRCIVRNCPNGYEKWKKEYLAGKLDEAKNIKFITVQYIFAGVGTYYATIEEEALESFECWINSNGSAFLGEIREATKREVENYFGIRVFEKEKTEL